MEIYTGNKGKTISLAEYVIKYCFYGKGGSGHSSPT